MFDPNPVVSLCVNQSGEKTKAKSCLASNIKKVLCRIGNPGTPVKRQVQKRKPSLVELSEEEEEPVEEIIEASRGPYDWSQPDPPLYHQQLLDDLVGVGARVTVVRRHIVAMWEDQWKLGVCQLQLEEIRMKVDFGQWTSEQGLAEMKKLPGLKPADLKKKPYKSSYAKWEVAQEKAAEKWKKGKERADPEEDGGADAE